jgi:hypothetical protein
MNLSLRSQHGLLNSRIAVTLLFDSKMSPSMADIPSILRSADVEKIYA